MKEFNCKIRQIFNNKEYRGYLFIQRWFNKKIIKNQSKINSTAQDSWLKTKHPILYINWIYRVPLINKNSIIAIKFYNKRMKKIKIKLRAFKIYLLKMERSHYLITK